MQSRRQTARFDAEMENSDRWSIERIREFERIDQPFPIASDQDIPTGRYTFTSQRVSYTGGPQRWASGNISYQWGNFYHGSIRSLSVSRGRVVVSNHLSLEPGASYNLLDLPEGEQTQAVFRLRSDYAFTPRMFASALFQYNEALRILSSNVRFRWEYAPGSELFVVWTDERDRSPQGIGLRGQALAIKITRLLRY